MEEAKRIVLIDPAQDAKAVLSQRLQMQGYAVVVAHAPAEGARLALADPPAAVIADLWMPSISGVQLCRLLKTEPATENVPVILRGPEAPRNRFWSERAGAAAYVAQGRMGDLVRALERAIRDTPPTDDFFTSFSQEDDIRERIAARLDAALFESVLSAEVRALGTCGEFGRLFDLLSQFVARVAGYRWLAVSTNQPLRLGLHANPAQRVVAECEARMALGLPEGPTVLSIEDEDASADPSGPPPIVRPIELGGIQLGQLALAPRAGDDERDGNFVSVIARELAGPVRMASLVEESQRLARIDALTGLLNRRAFSAVLQTELDRALRYSVPLSLLLLDVDHFKAVNDQRGHAAGDAVLAALGRLLARQARTSDHVGRWGGEEFVVALTPTDAAGALVAAERLRSAVAVEVIGDGAPIPVTASFGVATFHPDEPLEALVDRADRAMYAAKCAGRNRVATATATRDDGKRPNRLAG